MCYKPGWYLHVDMQLFCISMFILKLYKSKPNASKILILVLIFINSLQLFIFSQITGFNNAILMTEGLNNGSSWGF